MSATRLNYLNVSIKDFKSFGSIVVLPRISQQFRTKSAKYFLAACNDENKFNVMRLRGCECTCKAQLFSTLNEILIG